MMREAVQHGRGHLGVTEDGRPFAECQVGGDNDRRSFVELADEMEEQLTAGLAEGQISKLVDDDEIVAQQLLRQSPAFADRLFLFQLIDQIDEIVEGIKSLNM